MASQIDLKQSEIFIRDGYSNAGAVNLLAGYVAGSTTMVVDGINSIIPAGATFQLGTDDTIYEVLSQIATANKTTSITFAPPLVEAATDNEVITFLPNQIEVRIGEGNLTYEEKRPRKYRLNKGKIDSVKDDDEAALEVTMDFVWEHIISQSNGEPPTVEEVLKRNGNAANWVTSDPDTCQPYCVDLVIIYTPECSTEKREQIVLPKFRYESLSHSIKDSTVSCKGSCNTTTAIVTRID